MVDTLVPDTKPAVFPVLDVETALRNELLAAAKSAAELDGVSFPTDLNAQVAASIQIDSLVVVQTLVAAEKPLGFEPRPYYGPDEDCLTFYFDNAESYARRVDELLTLFLSLGIPALLATALGLLAVKATRPKAG